MAEEKTIRYKSNYLTNVIFRLDFHPILTISEKISPEFQEEIRTLFPILEEKRGFEYTSKIDMKEQKDEGSFQPFITWVFFNKDKTNKLSITSKNLTIENTKYKSFKDFKSTIEQGLNAFQRHYKSIVYTRIGVRYINQIDIKSGNPLEWSEYIANPLVYPIENFIGDKQRIARAMSQFIIKEDSHIVIFNYGIHNSEFPETISRKEFILDFDCNSKDVNNDVVLQAEEFHNIIQPLFESSILDPLRTLMGIEE